MILLFKVTSIIIKTLAQITPMRIIAAGSISLATKEVNSWFKINDLILSILIGVLLSAFVTATWEVVAEVTIFLACVRLSKYIMTWINKYRERLICASEASV